MSLLLSSSFLGICSSDFSETLYHVRNSYRDVRDRAQYFWKNLLAKMTKNSQKWPQNRVFWLFRSIYRAFSSSSSSAIITHNHLPFLKIFSNLVHFCPNFQIFCPFLSFLTFFCPFSEKSHTRPYFIE